MSATDICLSKQEVAALCRSPQRKRQLGFLQANGIRHYKDAHGWPVVLRSTVDGIQPLEQPEATTWRSNKAA
jgi:hypothetical protein